MIQAVLFDMYETLCTHYNTPLYFGAQIAADCGLAPESFLPLWRDAAREEARTLGRLTLEDELEEILTRFGLKDPHHRRRLIATVCEKRRLCKRQCLHALHPRVLPMLWGLKARGVKLGLISNCYLEEAAEIRAFSGMSCFDDLQLSCEAGLMKPDPAIYHRATAALGVKPEDCLYIGDGGSRELETARSLGMQAAQAVWYILPVPDHPSPLKEGFPQLHDPMDVIGLLG